MAGVEPATSSLPRMRSTTELHQQHELPCSLLLEKYECINKNRAENGAQTRDPQLGRLVLYRLSYFRELTTTSATVIFLCGSRWIRTTEGENQQIYSLPHLAALEYSQYLFQCSTFGASCRIRTNDPEITNHVLWPTELKRRVFALFATP